MGICREDCIGKKVKDIMPDIDPAWITRVGNVALSQVPQTFEENNLCLGKYFEISAFSPVKGKFAIIMEDITARKVHGDALEVANKKLNLLSSITRHDITNQLTILLGYLDLSKELATTPELSGQIEKEIKAAETIAHQIAFTKDYQDMGVLAPAWQNVSDVVNRVSETISLHPVTFEIGKNEIEIFADPLLEKVFYNLIDNSIRYAAGMTKISMNTRETPCGQVIIFEDNGKGIPANDKSRIFEHGFGKNTGLGLFLTREILSITGMTIEETGEFGTGARFEISVPSSIYRYSTKATPLHTQNISAWQYQAGLTKALEHYIIPGSSMNIPLYEQETKKEY
jgi:signal transduction histidine kinase